MGIVVIATYRWRHEAEFAKATLDANGINSIISADDAGGQAPYIMVNNPVRLLVDEEEADAARAALAENDGTHLKLVDDD